MNNPLSYLHDQLEQWRAEGTYQRLRILESESAAESRFDGHEVINLASNNYLGLTTHPKLREAAIAAVKKFGAARVRATYTDWFFLRNLIDDVEAMLGRADLEIASAYNVLAPATLHRFFEPIRDEYASAVHQVLAIKGCSALLDSDTTLQRGIQLRNPYVDPMNLMQVDLLQRWRATDRQDRDLFEALLASIGGIAQGLQSTG